MNPQPVVLLGDAVHTAHFSVGSGTKMAMEDAIALSTNLAEHPDDLAAALARYEHAAQPPVRQIQDSARPSLAWWEQFGRYHDAMPPWQFAYHFLSRSITGARLARRDPGFVNASHVAWITAHGATPLDTPFSHHGWTVPGRVVPITGGPDGTPLAVHDLPLSTHPQPGRWGALLGAPDSEAGLADAAHRLAALMGEGTPVLVAVHGGTPLTRTLLCEQARMELGLPALLIEGALDHDRAVTAVLSGRTDLIGVAA